MRIHVQHDQDDDSDAESNAIVGELIDNRDTSSADADNDQIPEHYLDGLPDDIREEYRKAYEDPKLLSIRDNIALLQARRKQLIKRLELGDSVAWRIELGKAWDQFVAARNRDEHDAMRDSFNMVAALLEAGSDDEGVWLDIQSIDRDLVKWKSMESERLLQVKMVLTAEQVAEKIISYHQAVENVVTDLEQRAEIGRQLRKVLKLPASDVREGATIP